MKKCKSCGYDNTDIMNYCLECGTALQSEPQMVVPLDSLSGQEAENHTEQVTEVYEKETVVGNRFAVQKSVPTFQQQQQPPKKSSTKLYLAIGGGLLAVLALFGAVLAGVLFVVIQNQQQKQTRPIVSETPINTDDNFPTPYPDSSPDVEKSPVVKKTPDTTNETITFPTPTRATKRGKYTVRTVSGWQLSNVKTIQSQNFSVKASGRIRLDGIKKRVGIKGVNGYKNRRVFPQYKTGALLMRTHYPDGKHSNIQPIGNGELWVNAPDETGKIEFLINDKSVNGNGGNFKVTVTDLGVSKQ